MKIRSRKRKTKIGLVIWRRIIMGRRTEKDKGKLKGGKLVIVRYCIK